MNFGEGYVVFCDDVRREANGKDILIGVYSGGDYKIYEAPGEFSAPMLSMVATVMIDPMAAPDMVRRLDVFLPGETESAMHFDYDIPAEAFGRKTPADPASCFPYAPMVARVVIGLADLSFKESGFVRVVMQYGEQQYLLGRLKVSFQEKDLRTPRPIGLTTQG